MAIAIGPLTEEYADAAFGLTTAVGWTHRREDWLFALSTGNGLGAFDGAGTLRGAAMWFPYGERHASIGMVAVDPSLQRAGIGRALMARAMADAGDRTLMLIATAPGQPLYERLGFRTIGSNAAHIGTAAAADATDDVAPAHASDLSTLMEMDGRALGCTRATLLSALTHVGESVVLRTADGIRGFAVCRAFGNGHVIGPVVAGSEDQARSLIAWWLARHAGQPVRVDVPGQHAGLAAWLSAQGLNRGGALPIMVRGEIPMPVGPERRYALVSQAMG